MATFEVHEHTFVSGSRANGMFIRARQKTTSTFSHSHEGGHVGHSHQDTGPSCYTIDKDDWYRSTGLRGGGRKKFTAKPSGEQMSIVELQDWQKSFELIVCNPTPSVGQPGYAGEGPGVSLPLRLMRQFDLTCIVKDGRDRT